MIVIALVLLLYGDLSRSCTVIADLKEERVRECVGLGQ